MRPTNVPNQTPETAILKALPGLPVLPPRNALIELAVFFAIIVGLEFGVDSLPDLNELEPHPFWLPVLLLSLQYGTVSGLLAAGVSILFTAFMGWPEQDIGENHFSYLIRIWAEPVLWIAASLVLGQFRMRQISERRVLHRNVQELRVQRTAIAAYSENLRERCERLERNIAGRGDPAGKALLNALAVLGTADPELFQLRFGAALEVLLGAGQYSLFALRGVRAELAASHGWSEADLLHRSFAADDPLAHHLLVELRGLTILQAGDETILAGQGMAAVPVRSNDRSRVLGFLKVEQILPERMGDELNSHLEMIAARLSGALELMGGDAILIEGDGRPRKAHPSRSQHWRKKRWHSPIPAPQGLTQAGKKQQVTKLRKPKIVR